MPRVSPELARANAAFARVTRDGYAIPGNSKKSMKGITATANSPDTDIIGKLSGMRALSRDGAMTSPLANSILRRHKFDVVNSGLILQSRVKRNILGLTTDQSRQWERTREAEFDMWVESPYADFMGVHNGYEQQTLAFFNMLLNGDVFFMTPWVERPDGFPYALTCHLIDADLVRNPESVSSSADIMGGVEKDASGRVIAIHVWNSYPDEMPWTHGRRGRSIRIPVLDSKGRRQVHHLFDPERLNQRRGVPLNAPGADILRQLSRAGDATLMNMLVAAYFTAFVRDSSGMNSLLSTGIDPNDKLFGDGSYDPNNHSSEPYTPGDGNDLEMGYGNVVYLDDQKDVTIADPKKTDDAFPAFFEALGTLAASSGNVPYERAVMKYNTSFTAAKAADNTGYNVVRYYRNLIKHRMLQVLYTEHTTEAILRNRQQAPRFFDDYMYRHAWCNSEWIGIGQGYLNPLQEGKAAVIRTANYQSTHEQEYIKYEGGGRWEDAMEKRAAEENYLTELGLVNKQDSEELAGSDGQEEDKEEGEDV